LCTLSHLNVKTANIRESTPAYQGAKLFNVMPKAIKNLKNLSVQKFKSAHTHLPKSGFIFKTIKI